MTFFRRSWFVASIALSLATPTLAGKLIDAVKARDVAQVRSLLAAGEQVDETVRGDYPLNVAALFGPAEMVTVLLEAGADIEQPGRGGLRPLHNAVMSGRKETVELMLQKGAMVDAKDSKGRSPLLYFAASAGSNIELARMLLAAGADPNIEDEDLERALNFSVYSGDIELAELLIAAHADVNHQNVQGESPLHAAAGHSRYDFVKVLIAAGADVNQLNKSGYPPLFYASDAAMRQLLIEAGAK